MWLVRELLFHRKQHYLNVIANAMAVFLVLIVSVLSDSLAQGISDEIRSLGLDVTMLQVYGEVNDYWFDDFCSEFDITKATPYYSFQYEELSVVSCNDKLYELFEPGLLKGRFLNETDLRNNDNVAVVGSEAYEKNDRKDTVEINGVEFRIIGVLNRSENNLFIDYDKSVFIPAGYDLSTGVRNHSYYYADGRYAEPYLEDAFGENGYMLINQSSLLKTTGQMSELVRKVLLFIASVSLAVSLTGMINSMLAGIKERSYEIGIKKVMGASAFDIYCEFALESFTVFSIGLVIGLILVTLTCRLISSAGIMDICVDHMENLRLLFRLSLAGFVCGLYPAWRAGRITIMDAIRKV